MEDPRTPERLRVETAVDLDGLLVAEEATVARTLVKSLSVSRTPMRTLLAPPVSLAFGIVLVAGGEPSGNDDDGSEEGEDADETHEAWHSRSLVATPIRRCEAQWPSLA
jgi:hypothetical protein